MQLAAAIGLLVLAYAYSVKTTQRRVTFKDKVLAVTLMWPVAGVFYSPLLDLRNHIWMVLGGLALLWILRYRKSIVSHLWPLLVLLVYMMLVSLCWAVNSTDSVARTLGSALMTIYVIAQVWTRPPRKGLSIAFDALTSVSFGIIILLAWGISQENAFHLKRFQMFQVGLRATDVANFALVAAIILGGRGLRERGGKRLALLTLSASAFVLMMLTKTRGTLLSLICIIGFLAVFESGKQQRTLKVVCFLLVLTFPALFYFTPGYIIGLQEYYRLMPKAGHIYDPEGDLFMGRKGLWEKAMEKARDRPFLGRGTGASNFVHLSDQFVKSKILTKDLQVATVHSQYVETYYDHGLVGLGLLVFVLVWITQAAFKVNQHPPRGLGTETKTMVWLWITVPIGMLSHGGYLSSGNTWRMWIWIAGMVLVCLDQTRRRAQRSNRIVLAEVRQPRVNREGAAKKTKRIR